MFRNPNLASVDQSAATENADWDMVSHEEASGYYTDRILLVLGTDKVNHHLPIASIRHSSVLLMNTARLPPSDRHLRLPALDSAMLKTYITMDSAAPFAQENSWSGIIKLGIAADVLQDPIVTAHAVTALKKKEKLVESGGEGLSTEDFGIAWKFCRATGGADWIMMVLNQIRERLDRRAKTARAPETQTVQVLTRSQPNRVSPPSATGAIAVPQIATSPSAQNRPILSNTPNLNPGKPLRIGTTRFTKYSNSAFRSKLLASRTKEEDDKWAAMRQPSVPPSIEALKTGTVGNFVWPALAGEATK
jgi:hypothetical protein